VTFSREWALWAIPVLVGLMLLALRVRSRRLRRLEGYLQGHPGPELWPFSPAPARLPGLWKGRALLLALSGTALGLALAGPRLGTRTIPVSAPAAPLYILLDISPSMAVGDVPGGRLAGARILVRRVLAEVPDLPVALGVFAGDSHLLLPPASDPPLFLRTLDAVDFTLLAGGGTRLASALNMVLRQWQAVGMDGGPGVLLLSDGEDHGSREEALALAREIREGGGWVSSVILGTRAGGPVPRPGTPGPRVMAGVLGAEAEGESPHSRADPEFLTDLVAAGGGALAAWNSPQEVTGLMGALESWGSRETRDVKLEEVPLEAWPVFLFLAVAGFLVEGLLDRAHAGRKEGPWR